jgi:hypothetical protein
MKYNIFNYALLLSSMLGLNNGFAQNSNITTLSKTTSISENWTCDSENPTNISFIVQGDDCDNVQINLNSVGNCQIKKENQADYFTINWPSDIPNTTNKCTWKRSYEGSILTFLSCNPGNYNCTKNQDKN